MKPGEPLFERYAPQVDASTPRIYSYAETRSLTTHLLDYARTECKSVSVPRLGHYRTALQRSMSAEGVSLPDGRIYKTASYEDFSLGEPPIDYENKFLLQTNDVDDSKGRITNFLDKLLDETPKHKGTFVIFGVITPKDVPGITSVESITFAVVQATSGEAFGFTFKENSNKGKVRATEGMSDEWGETRDRMGYFDTCSVEAVRLDNEAMAQIRLELEKAKNATASNSGDEASSVINRFERVQEIGRTILTKLAPTRASTKT